MDPIHPVKREVPKLEHLHIYRWNAEKTQMFCSCGKPIPTRNTKVIWK